MDSLFKLYGLGYQIRKAGLDRFSRIEERWNGNESYGGNARLPLFDGHAAGKVMDS